MKWRTFVNGLLGFLVASVISLFLGGYHHRNDDNRIDAIIACMNNDAYVGINNEDTRALFLQCLDDYKER